MIYFYAILLIVHICIGVIAAIAGDYELAQHEEIAGFLILILITLEDEERK